MSSYFVIRHSDSVETFFLSFFFSVFFFITFSVLKSRLFCLWKWTARSTFEVEPHDAPSNWVLCRKSCALSPGFIDTSRSVIIQKANLLVRQGKYSSPEFCGVWGARWNGSVGSVSSVYFHNRERRGLETDLRQSHEGFCGSKEPSLKLVETTADKILGGGKELKVPLTVLMHSFSCRYIMVILSLL